MAASRSRKPIIAQVIKLTTEALSKKSKDLQLAAWLTEALLRQQGAGGLADGLDLLRGLVENFWDSVYPELEDGDAEMRATPLEWVGIAARRRRQACSSHAQRPGLVPLQGFARRAVRSRRRGERSQGQRARDGARRREDDAGGVRRGLRRDSHGVLHRSSGRVRPGAGIARSSRAGLRREVRRCGAELRPVADRRRGSPADGANPARQARRSRGGGPRRAGGRSARIRGVFLRGAGRPAGGCAGQEGGAGCRTRGSGRRLRSAWRPWRATCARNHQYSPVPYLLLRGLRWGELRANGSASTRACSKRRPRKSGRS